MEIGLSIPLQRGHVHVATSFGSTTPTLSEKRSMFILGMGFMGQSLARKLHNQGWVVSGTCTAHVKKKQLQDMGFHVHLFDANHPEDTFCLAGVYGDCDGELVDEDYPTNPKSESAKLRLASEEGWSNLAHNLGISLLLFRLGGIYGPGRSAVDTIIKQKPMSEGQKRRKNRKYTSRIHVDDICQALMATVLAPPPREVYNIVDDDPAPREEVFEYATRLVEKKWPGLKLQSVEQRQKEWSNVKNPRGEKRLCNARMKRELGVQLLTNQD
ncbi:hypothetical protein JHK84_039439 [Glycine max]|nr:hypothetical protein JHK86_039213 [Glycine max]KAG4964816.1 hypothetical protein JHK85_039791 [Glycine max]KAG5121099.1 hypothetical protein JHK84_039439 [Glycine max]